MTSDWDDDEKEVQVKDEDKDKGNDQPTNPTYFAVITIILKTPKPSISEYLARCPVKPL